MANVGIDFAQHVKSVLAGSFPGAQIDVDRFGGSERVGGHIIWQGFEDLDQVDRQRQVYQTLRRGLGAETTHISLILAYSPQEWAIMHEDDENE